MRGYHLTVSYPWQRFSFGLLLKGEYKTVVCFGGKMMFDLEKIALLVVSRMGHLLVDHRRCTRVRSPLSQCSLCQDICPVRAISFGQDGISLADNCLECGLCAGVCPTGALKIQEPTERNVLDKIEKMGENGVPIVVACSRNQELDERVLKVPCLGSLSREFLLVLDGLSFPIHLIYSEKTCSICPVSGGGNIYLEKLEEVRSFEDSLGLGIFSIKNVETVPSLVSAKKISHSDMGRREFFRSMWGGAKKVPLMALESLLGTETEPEAEKGITELPEMTVDRLEFLKRALASVTSEFQLPFLLRPQLQKTCYFCRTCAVLCPVGALKCVVGGDYQLFLHQDLCTGCGLCTQVCYHQSLGLVPATVSGVKSEEPLVLALGEKKNCSTCGQEIIVSGPVEECFMCQKKAVLDE